MQKKQKLPKERVAVPILHLPLHSGLPCLLPHPSPCAPALQFKRLSRQKWDHASQVPHADHIKLRRRCQQRALYWNIPMHRNCTPFPVQLRRIYLVRVPGGRQASTQNKRRLQSRLSRTGIYRHRERFKVSKQRNPGDYAERYKTDRNNGGNYTSHADITKRTRCRAHPAPPPKSCSVPNPVFLARPVPSSGRT